MRLTSNQWPTTLALALTLALSVATVGACSKSDPSSESEPEAKVAAEKEAEAEPSKAGGDEVKPDEVEDEASDANPPEAADKLAKPEAAAQADAPAKPPEARGDKARDRVKASREEGAEEGNAKSTKAQAELAKAADAAAPAGESEAGSATEENPLLSPAERRKVERERRIAELKRRNEERRKARMAKVDDQRRESEAEGAVQRENAAIEARTAPKAPARVMSLKKFISEADMRTLLSNDTLVEEGGLSGIAPSEGYNSAYFAPPVRSSFGVSVQVWKDKTRRDANVRFRRMRAQYANAEDTTAPTAKSFVSQWGDILTLSFANLTKRVVVSVSCGDSICKPAQLLSVAKSISSKL